MTGHRTNGNNQSKTINTKQTAFHHKNSITIRSKVLLSKLQHSRKTKFKTEEFSAFLKLTRILRHSWEDPAGGHEAPSRKSCCLSVPSSLALQTTLGFPTSTCKGGEGCDY